MGAHPWVASLAEQAAAAIEVAGIAAIIVGSIISAGYYARDAWFFSARDAYHSFRRRLGRSILLGLEMLVAADIILTVTMKASLANLGILAAIVAIRTFLSFSLEVEISGHWPWQGYRHLEAPAKDIHGRQDTGPVEDETSR